MTPFILLLILVVMIFVAIELYQIRVCLETIADGEAEITVANEKSMTPLVVAQV